MKHLLNVQIQIYNIMDINMMYGLYYFTFFIAMRDVFQVKSRALMSSAICTRWVSRTATTC